jgi:hypothetical protein
MRLVKEEPDFLPFPCGCDLAVTHTILQTIRALPSTFKTHNKDHPSSVSPRWWVERVKGFYKVVGLSCDRFEDKLMALFEEIEASRDQTLAKTMSTVPSTSRIKVQR